MGGEEKEKDTEREGKREQIIKSRIRSRIRSTIRSGIRSRIRSRIRRSCPGRSSERPMSRKRSVRDIDSGQLHPRCPAQEIHL